MAKFTKGEAVTYLQNWDRKGTVRIVNLVVYSCGKQRMVLVDEAGVKFPGMFFQPVTNQYDFGRVVSRLTAEQAEIEGLRLGAEIASEELRRLKHCIAANVTNKGYIIAINKDIADLHEPRIVKA